MPPPIRHLDMIIALTYHSNISPVMLDTIPVSQGFHTPFGAVIGLVCGSIQTMLDQRNHEEPRACGENR